MSAPTCRAAIGERGCGEERTPGGVYAESGLGPNGVPLEEYLVDPPVPVPPGLDLANKAMIWTSGNGMYHLLIHIGAEFYPYVADIIEEIRAMGASRKINPNLDLRKLSRYSRMILVHPRCRNVLWEEQAFASRCKKHILGHQAPEAEEGVIESVPLPAKRMENGPCLYQTYDLIPVEDGRVLPFVPGEATVNERVRAVRTIGSTTYHYHPSGEDLKGLTSGIFAALPLTGFALIHKEDGGVNEEAKKKFEAADVPFYESDK